MGTGQRGEAKESVKDSGHCQVKGAALAAANYAPGKIAHVHQWPLPHQTFTKFTTIIP